MSFLKGLSGPPGRKIALPVPYGKAHVVSSHAVVIAWIVRAGNILLKGNSTHEMKVSKARQSGKSAFASSPTLFKLGLTVPANRKTVGGDVTISFEQTTVIQSGILL
jgi:hypothetical protein